MPLMSNNVIVIFELKELKEYKNCSFLPNVNPSYPQSALVLPIVSRDHSGALENLSGSNFNKNWPRHVPSEDNLKFKRTYALWEFGLSELISSDFIRKSY